MVDSREISGGGKTPTLRQQKAIETANLEAVVAGEFIPRGVADHLNSIVGFQSFSIEAPRRPASQRGKKGGSSPRITQVPLEVIEDMKTG